MSRRLILILIILLALAGVGAFLYNNRKLPAPTSIPEVIQDTQTAVKPLPVSEPVAVKPLPINEPIIESEPVGLRVAAPISIVDYWLDPADRTIYLAGQNGIVYSLLSDGGAPTDIFRVPVASESSISGYTGSGVSPEALVEYRNEAGLKTFAVINPALDKSRFLPAGTISASWSPNGLEVAYVQEKIGLANSLFILTLSSNKSRKLTDLPLLDPILDWVTNNEIAISSRSADSITGSGWMYSIKNKVLTKVGDSSSGLTLKWRQDGLVGLRYTNPQSAQLEIINNVGKSLGKWASPTIPEKCLIDYVGVICATPSEKVSTSRLRDSYLQHDLYTRDRIVGVLTTGNLPASSSKTFFPIEKGESLIDAYRLEKNGGLLYFINRYDNKLYSLPLK